MNENEHVSTSTARISDRDMYYLLESKRVLSEATFNELPASVSDHIIVCGGLYDPDYFVTTLRVKALKKDKPIVILQPELTPETWGKICKFTNIYYIPGTSVIWTDLIKAGIMVASQVLIMPNLSEYNNRPDVDGILTYQLIEYNRHTLRASLQINIELVDMDLLKLLPLGEMNKYDSLLFASGHVSDSQLFDSLTMQTFFNPWIPDIVKCMVNFQTISHKRYGKTNLELISIPEGYEGRLFMQLYTYLLFEKDILLFALYRIGSHNHNAMSYVFTNPMPNTIIESTDRIFALIHEN